MALSLDLLFSVAGSVAALGWLALAVAPLRYSWPRGVTVAAALAIAACYAALIGVFWVRADGGFGSLDAVARLFEHRGVLLAGWVHYLAFDLLVGVWERDEAQRLGVPQLLLVPCLLLTFLFGPLGWLAFLAVRHLNRRAARMASVPL
ncbi:MAG TPA: abscisic acid-deficient protein Aba4 family protein [Burkholderiaceae bacterium]|nr:abscisic acid-deficient protein Aba4 family protein [Burkholderiaceae bacterium]